MRKEIHVLGLGPGIENYKKNRKYPVTTVGVNDIWRYFETDYVLCIDKIRSFTKERANLIANSCPHRFFTCWPEWKSVMELNGIFVELIEIDNKIPGRGGLVESLDNERVLPFHVDSTFSATCLAYHMIKKYPGAPGIPGICKIVLFGCRFLGHPQLQNFIPVIRESYLRLYNALRARDIFLYNADKESALYDVLPFYKQ